MLVFIIRKNKIIFSYNCLVYSFFFVSLQYNNNNNNIGGFVMNNIENMSTKDIIFELLKGSKNQNDMVSENETIYKSINLLENVLQELTPAKKRFANMVLELYKRSKTNKENSKVIQNSRDAFDLCKSLAFLDYEVIRVIALNARNCVIEFKNLFKGGYTNCISDNRIIFKYLLNIKATSFILVHNHPSGCKYPSKEDNNLTKSLLSFGGLVNIKLLDHIIVSGENDYFSYADEGKLTL